MTTIPHQTPVARRRISDLAIPEMWGSLAIIAMWLAVLCDAVWGPDIVINNPPTISQIPSAVVLGLFAALATWALAKYAFRRPADDR